MKITFRKLMLPLLLILILLSCKPVYGPEEKLNDISALMQLNENQRKAHMYGDAEMLAAEIADTMISVSRGHIYINSNREIYDRFNNYFKNIEYIKWDDLEDPIINISDDGSYAEMIFKKIVQTRHKNEIGNWEKSSTLFSWSAYHKKLNGKWKIVSNTSTRESLEFPTYDEFYSKGMMSFRNNKFDESLYYFERAYYIAPDNVTILYNFAKALTLNNHYEKAISVLQRLAEIRFIGLNNFETDTLFQNLKQQKNYYALLEKIKENKKTVSRSEIAFSITEKDLIPEGIAFDSNTGTIYLSSAYKRKILSIDKNGIIKDFKSEVEDGLWSTWGMEVDEMRNHLWVISSSTSQGMLVKKSIPQEQYGKSKIYKYDLTTGNLLKIYTYDAAGQEHFFNDLTISKSGDVYITESLTSKIYKISDEKDEIELLYQADPMFSFLNGLALNNDESKLFVASSEGISILNLETLNWQLLQHPKNVSLEGIDGLTYYNGSLIAQQSGYPVNSVMLYFLDESDYKITGSKILESNNPFFDSATTGEISGEYYYYIANSQVRSAFEWKNTGPDKIKPLEQLKELVLLKVKL
ncbi:MAG: hypothetical protein KJ571_04270 [Bacteroidetes bacterium]|nr:hypothetical protein [Bacteroidota bacterium]